MISVKISTGNFVTSGNWVIPTAAKFSVNSFLALTNSIAYFKYEIDSNSRFNWSSLSEFSNF